MRDLKDQLGDYLDHVVGHLEAQDVYERWRGTLALQPEQSRTSRRLPPTWMYGLAAAVSTLLVVGAAAWLFRNAQDQAQANPVDQPVDASQLTLDDFEFTEAPAGMLGWTPFVLVPGILSNGSHFLTESEDGTDWVSIDGVTWLPNREGVRPFHGGMGEFLAITSSGVLRRSSDGLGWSEAEPKDAAPRRFETYRYFGLEVDEILSLSLSLPDAWNGGGAAGAILKLDDTYIAYYFTADYWQSSPLEGETSYLGAAVSSDGRTWRPVEAPDFLHDWFHDESRAMWDRGLSEQTWAWTFAINGDRVLALTGDSDGHTLWESTDGLRWEPLSISFLEQPSFDVFGYAPRPHDTPLLNGSNAPSPFSYRVTALEQGWAILPTGGIEAGEEAEERGVLFSVDGHNWLPLQFEEGFAAAAGDKIFVRSFANMIVATYKGSRGQG
jgi:hypothetical protein